MYLPRTKGYCKRDPVMRWALPDRVFFACGACHILAYAFLQRYSLSGLQPIWLKPGDGHTGNHIFVAARNWVFDYHGYAERRRFMEHTFRSARRRWPGWTADEIVLPREVLVSEQLSRTYNGLWLREPKQFLHDALPRAEAFLDRFPVPTSMREVS